MEIITPTSPDSLRLTQHGLHITAPLSYEDWLQLLASARRAKDCYLSILSDITAHGRQQFGDDAVNAALEQMQFDLGESVKAEFIALVPIEQRAEHDLSSEHAYVLGKFLDTPEARAEWAAKCREHMLSAFELKKSIEKGEVIRGDEISANSGHSEGIPSVQAVHFQFLRWQRQFKERSAILRLPKREREKILTQLTPMVELAAEIEESLTQKKK
jgi:hypothetical protein